MCRPRAGAAPPVDPGSGDPTPWTRAFDPGPMRGRARGWMGECRIGDCRGTSMKASGLLLSCALFLSWPWSTAVAELQAGAAVVDVTPERFPVLVNGNMLSQSATGATSRLNARALVLDDGRERVAIVVVDSCMMSRELLDEAKQLASRRTKI